MDSHSRSRLASPRPTTELLAHLRAGKAALRRKCTSLAGTTMRRAAVKTAGYSRKLGAVGSAREGSTEAARVDDDGLAQSSRSRNSSDSSPSFASVASKSQVEGGRRPE